MKGQLKIKLLTSIFICAHYKQQLERVSEICKVARIPFVHQQTLDGCIVHGLACFPMNIRIL